MTSALSTTIGERVDRLFVALDHEQPSDEVRFEAEKLRADLEHADLLDEAAHYDATDDAPEQ